MTDQLVAGAMGGFVADETKEVEHEASVPAEVEAEPTPDEEAAADATTLDPEVAQSGEEALEHVASFEGEGRIA